MSCVFLSGPPDCISHLPQVNVLESSQIELHIAD